MGAALTRRQALAAVAGAVSARGAESRPNVLFILADDMGYADLSCYGRRDYATPNIDRLARQGVRFTQAYANSAVCTASRVALATGRYQYRLPIGLEEPLTNRPVGLPPEHPTMASLFRKAGYGTTLIGKWHLGSLPTYGPQQSGYDRFWGFRGPALDYFTHKSGGAKSDTADLWDGEKKIERKGYLTNLLADEAIRSIQGYTKAKKPFLVSLHLNAPHWPWEGPEDEALAGTLTNLSSFDHGNLKTYGRMVEAMDRQVGRVLAALERSGAAKNTIVVFTSDNGGERFSDTWPFTGKKTELLEGGLRVPAIVRWPGRIRAGSVTQQVAMGMDWVPTLLAAAGAGADAAYPFDGVNLLPVLTGKEPVRARRVYWRYRLNEQRAVRDGDLKYLKINGNEFLFDVAADPLERANLKSKQPEKFRELAGAWAEWEKTMLPLDPKAYTYGFHPETMADHYAPAAVPPM